MSVRFVSERRARHPESLRLLGGGSFGFVHGFLWWSLLGFALLALVAGLLSWCFAMAVTVTAQGAVLPCEQHTAKAEAAGIIREISVVQGQRVERGDVLVRLDDTVWRAELAMLEKDLEANESRQSRLNLELAGERRIRKAQVTLANWELDRARLHLARVRAEQSIYSAGTSPSWTRRPLDELVPVCEAQALVDGAEAELSLARQQLAATEARREELGSLVAARDRLCEQKELLRQQLSRAVICAGASGTVLTRDLSQRVGDRMAAGEAILVIARPLGWKVRANVAERDVPKVREGQEARVYVDAFPYAEHGVLPGRVASISSQREPAGGFSADVLIEDSLETPATALALASGMGAEVRIIIDEGRVMELIWRRVLRQVGRLGDPGVRLVPDGEES